MRILFILAELGTGGAAVVHRLLADRLTAMGEVVDVFAYSSDGWQNIFGTYPRERIVFGSEMSLTQLLCSRDYSIIHAESNTPDRGVQRSMKLARCKSPVVLTCHGLGLPACNLSFADVFVTVSDDLAAQLGDRVSLPTRTIHNGIDETVFHTGPCESSPRPIILWVGRPYEERKDLIGFASLATGMKDDPVDFLVAAACPPDYPLSLGEWLGGRVTAVRNLPQSALADVYRRVAASGGCTVSTSLSEGLPLSNIESLACGCPVVAPTVGGIPEVLDSANGVLYDRSVGTDGLRTLVLRLIAADPSDRGAMVDEGLKTVSRCFTATRMAEDYHGLYTCLLKQARPRRSSAFDWAARCAVRGLCGVRRLPWSSR